MIYTFDNFELDTQTRELRRVGVPIPLTPKVYQVLAYLLEHRNRLVLQEELLEQVWPGTYVDDSAVRRCIAAIRRALGEAAHAPQRIKTFHRQGYRFIAAITVYNHVPPETNALPPVAFPPATPESTTASLPVALASSPPSIERFESDVGMPEAITDAPRCAAYQHTNSATARFCIACGAPLGLSCPHCGQTVPQPAAFCPACGQRLATASPSPPQQSSQPTSPGERKLVTVLYCTVVNATTLLEGVRLDAMHSLMQTLYTLVLTEVRQYEGTIQYASGEGFLVLFGAPVAQEDHAWRAVLAALGLQRRLRERQPPLRLPSGEAVIIRMALHTGLVVVGEMGDDLHRTAVVVGEAAMLTRTLVRQAMPDTIVASESTVRLLQGEVEAVALPPLRVDGQQTPMAVYQILGCTPWRVPQAAAETRPRSPFVGRNTELALLLARLARTELGRGQVVAIVGEPGMGKSRLLDEFRQQVRMRQVTYLQGHCRSYGRAIPYLPIVDLLRATWGITEVDSPETITTKVHIGLQMVHMVPDTWASSLLSLFGVESQAASVASLEPGSAPPAVL